MQRKTAIVNSYKTYKKETFGEFRNMSAQLLMQPSPMS